MAKTYKDPYREYTDATDVGADQLLLSADKQAGISQAKLDWQKASEAGDQAGMDSAHQRAEAIRAQAGYSGGANGGAYNQFADSGAHMSGTHMSSPRWTPTYEKERADTLSQLQSRKPFSYDPEKDPTYQQYKAQYERGAQKSMQDTMGQVMARTGGLASSFAQTAGQQSYNAAMAQLADKVPELRQLAYQMYMDEGNRLRSDLQMYDSLDSSDAARWQATVLSPFQSDRAYALDVDNTLYNRGQKEREWAFKEDERDYTREQDAWERTFKEDERDYTRKREETLDQAAKDKALAELLAGGGNYSGYEGLYGLSPEDAAALGALWSEDRDYAKRDADLDLLYKQAQITAANRSNRGSGGGGGGGGSQTGDPLDMIRNMSESEAKRALLGMGLPQWQVNEYMALWKGGQIPPGTALSGKAATWENELAAIEDKWSENPKVMMGKVLDVVEKAQRQGLSDEQARRILARYGMGG